MKICILAADEMTDVTMGNETKSLKNVRSIRGLTCKQSQSNSEKKIFNCIRGSDIDTKKDLYFKKLNIEISNFWGDIVNRQNQ